MRLGNQFLVLLKRRDGPSQTLNLEFGSLDLLQKRVEKNAPFKSFAAKKHLALGTFSPRPNLTWTITS